MGEMADFDLEEVECFEDLRFGYSRGQVSQEEAYETGIIDEQGYFTIYKNPVKSSPIYEEPDPPNYWKTCKYCGAEELYWKQYEHGWRLTHAFGHQIHECDDYKKTKLDFGSFDE